MRIAIFSDNFYPEMSGITDSIIASGKELARRGHFVHYFVPKYSTRDFEVADTKPEELNLGERVSITRFPSFHYPTPNNQGRGVIPLPWRWLKVKKFNPDIIHTHLFYGAGIEALISGKLLKTPIVGTNHTAVRAFLIYSPIHADWFNNLLIKYSNWYYERCDFVATPSRAILEEMQFDGFKKEAHIISNPIDTGTFRPLSNKNSLKKKFGVGNFTIIHAGRLSRERSVEVIIKSLQIVKKKIPEAELLIAGRGVAENELRELASSLGLQKSITFLGFLSKPALAEAYNASEVFVITSPSDTQSMVMMQAMASGLPIVGVKARALPEYINKKNGFVVPVGDEAAVAEKIIYLLKNRSTSEALGRGAQNFAKEFSTECIVDEWEKIYEKIIKNNGTNKREQK